MTDAIVSSAPATEMRPISRAGALVDLFFGYDFFVSYAHADGVNYATELASGLQSMGYKVFLDRHEYTAGEALHQATRRRIGMSRKLVVVARPAALSSEWVAREVEVSLAASKSPIGQHLLFLDLQWQQRQCSVLSLAIDDPAINTMNGGNIFQGAPEDPDQEQFSTLLEDDRLRIVRIVSRGQSSPATGWYDQSENEWVMVLKGGAILSFDDGRSVTMAAGDFLHIPRHSRHRVDWTDPDKETIWLAVHYR